MDNLKNYRNPHVFLYIIKLIPYLYNMIKFLPPQNGQGIMKDKKIKMDIFGGMNYVSINGTRVNSQNISNFNLIPDDKIGNTQYYKVNKSDRKFFIYHDLDTDKVDWVESKY